MLMSTKALLVSPGDLHLFTVNFFKCDFVRK